MTGVNQPMSPDSTICGLIPCYNPGPVVKQVVTQALDHLDQLILVDDGCDQDNATWLDELSSQHPDITLLRHPHNLGKGFAIKTGLLEALKGDCDYIIMLDSDGQHHTDDLPLFKDKINQSQPPFIMGVRQDIKAMPLKSKIGNTAMSLAFRLSSGKPLSDTQSGYRALSRDFARSFLENCKPGRYETEMKMLFLAAKLPGPIEQVPIQTIYFDNNKATKFRAVQDSVRVLSSFLLFAGVGILSFLIDYGLFLLFTFYGGSHFLNAHVMARVFSALFNFVATKKWVFNHQQRWLSSAAKYLMAVLLSLLLSSSVLYLLVDRFAWHPAVAKPITELITFVINFFVLRHFVFRQDERT